jgi:hypothetical protein
MWIDLVSPWSVLVNPTSPPNAVRYPLPRKLIKDRSHGVASCLTRKDIFKKNLFYDFFYLVLYGLTLIKDEALFGTLPFSKQKYTIYTIVFQLWLSNTSVFLLSQF